MFTGLNLSDVIFSPNHRQPSGASPSSPVIMKTQIILFYVTFSTLHVHHRDWFSVNSLQEDDQICVPERWYTDRLQELQSVSHTKPCLGWCWHSSCHALKKHTDFIFNDARIPGENAKQRAGNESGSWPIFQHLSSIHCQFATMKCWHVTSFSYWASVKEYNHSSFIVIFLC